MSAAVRTTCPYCGVGCGVIAKAAAHGAPYEISGDPAHPANFGRLCSKGSALGDTLGLDGRLLHPQVEGRRASWNDALDFVASGLRRILDTHGANAVALYVSGQLLTEDYYVANKLVKGYLGTANIDTNSRLCMASAVAGHKRAFGEDVVPVSYDDVDRADLVVLVGSNTAWCHPIVHQRIVAARERTPKPKLVVVDPRRTATCEDADLHLSIRAGTDVWLFNGLLAFLDRHGHADRDFVRTYTDGVDAALAVAHATAGDPDAVAERCGVDVADLTRFYSWFAATPRVVTLFSQGVNQSSSGTDKVNSIINCHLLTGRIGKPGAGPFSITGQPNAMGGREVGGFANTLAAHLDLDARGQQIVQSFWKSPHIATQQGPKAVEMFERVHRGEIKAIWIMATNPVVSLPDADRVREALSKCELVIVSDCVASTDTLAAAHVALPALGWGEKDGTVTNSERRISRQRAFLPAPGEAKADWWIVCEVAKRLGFGDAFAFSSAAAIFDEHARLSAHENDGARAFDLGALAGMTREQYDALEPVRWGSASGIQFSHPDRRARFVATSPKSPVNSPSAEFPLVLNTGRIRDQWHTMTRTGRSARLTSHLPEPFAELHPADALLYGVRDGGLARVATRWGAMVVRLRESADQPRGSVFAPIHWNDTVSSDARVGALVNPEIDPISGEPEFKHTPARLEPFDVDWHGFVLARHALAIDGVTWWTRIQGERFTRYELAGRGPKPDWAAWARRLLAVDDDDADWLDYRDDGAATYRAAHLVDDRMHGCVFVSPRQDLPSRSWLSSLFAKTRIEEIDRVGLLIGAPPTADSDPGPTVCSCFGVGRNVIARAIREQKLSSAKEVTACLKAGGNCGSCLPEIRRLVAGARG
ncbi:MAG TPA: molybdopterin-dependent oxidoreductase [Nevskiaceae bacterium]|nr:molybdopterin-dependent oxidoreductase [Nevskiaceae bacterium]